MIALTAKVLYTPIACVERPLVLIEDEKILEISSLGAREVPEGVVLLNFPDGVLAPGFIDIHIHGGAGHDVMEPDPPGQAAMEKFLARHGVSSYLATTVTAPVDTVLAALERLADVIEVEAGPWSKAGARPLGIHLEGPFISHSRRGVHPPENLLPPTVANFERFWEASRGHIRVMTIAPEVEGASEVIAEAVHCGVCVSLGHSDADLVTTRRAIELGARHATHTFNAMRPLAHRDPGIIGEVLTNPQLSADIIADGIHLDPAVVQLFLRAKGAEGAVLITDAISATGMPDGHYRLGTLDVEVKDGKCTSGGNLAGSVLTMDRAIRNVMSFAGWDLQQALRLTTVNPAAAAGLTGKGVLRVGADADFVVLNPCGEVNSTIIRGVVI